MLHNWVIDLVEVSWGSDSVLVGDSDLLGFVNETGNRKAFETRHHVGISRFGWSAESFNFPREKEFASMIEVYLLERV